MKYVNPLTEAEIITLDELMKNNACARVRTRAHAVLLSHRRFKMNEIARIYAVDRDTVSRWLSDWETYGLIGLYDDMRSGRPPKLTIQEVAGLNSLLQEEPRSMKRLARRVEHVFHKIVSVDTLKRWARKSGLVWKRIRKSLKDKREEAAFRQAQQEIKQLRDEQQAGLIDLYYFDETGFVLTPMVPYAWQPKGKTIGLLPSKSQRLNVLGFFSLTNDFYSFIFQGRIDAPVVVACFEAFSKTLLKPTWIILDNAAQHTSTLFKAQLASWEQRGLFVKFLPAYSPELNLIEILWRFIKYVWLPFSAYIDFASLKNALENILENIGTKYRITFA